MNVTRDYMASRFIINGSTIDGYSRMYYCTNENLGHAVRNLDIRDKSVMTVLASSDQLFSFDSLGAKKVDTFDKNMLTIYYYYLRKWSIKYNGQILPEFITSNDYESLKELLSMVKIDNNNEDERQAFVFWRKHLEHSTNFKKMFFPDYLHKPVLYNLEDAKATIKKPVSFKQIDMTKKTLFDKKYDLVYLSNIIEWFQLDKAKLEIIKKNLLKLIDEDGKVLCTTFFKKEDGQTTPTVQEVFDNDFETHVLSERSYYLSRK